MNGETEGGYTQPTFDREPDFINDIGTRFWEVDDFDDILEKLPIDLKIVYSEFFDEEESEIIWGYCIIESDTVQFESVSIDDIQEILETVKQESIDRGLIEIEFEPE